MRFKHRNFSGPQHSKSLFACGAFLFAFILSASSSGQAAKERVHPSPHFTTGQTIRYQLDIRDRTKGGINGPIKNPEAASELAQSTNMIVRLEVLQAGGDATDDPPGVRMRATFERATAINQSDAYDAQADALADEYHKLEGKSFEFAIAPDGQIGEVSGLDAVVQNPTVLASVRSSLANLVSGATFPKKGIVIGEKWHSEQTLPGAPLRGTVWRSESSYERNEPCGNSAAHIDSDVPMPEAAPGLPAESEKCAVILTQFKIFQSSPHGDLTPPDYVQAKLHTAGTWTGSGQSLNAISLRTGLVMSVTQTSEQKMDFTISSPTSPTKLAYNGQVESKSQITLLP